MDQAVKPSEQSIVAASQHLKNESVELLKALVAEPSLLGKEGPAQALVKASFSKLGLKVHEFLIDEEKLKKHEAYSPSIISYAGRPNVVGIHQPKGRVKGKSLILNGHIDVVPVGAESLWSRPPFSPHVEGDRLYGRGSADMKAGIVAYIMAFKALQNLGFEPAAPVYFQSVVEEECTGNGALACLIEGYTADAALITEPVAGVMTGQMGVMWLAIETKGVPVHAAYAHTGVAAIEFAQYLVSKLRELERHWNEPAQRHRLFCNHDHPINFNLGKISGGEWASSVPTECRVDLRLGFYPGIKPADARRQVEALLAEAYAAHPSAKSLQYKIVYQGFQAEGLEVDMEQPIITELIRAHEDVSGKAIKRSPFTGTTDVKYFHLHGGIPSTCYGPIGADIHGIDEWVSIDSMVEVSAVLAVLMARWCGLNPV
jgi:acetylornithine deacetylase